MQDGAIEAWTSNQVSAIWAKTLTMMGIIYNVVEYTVQGRSSGCHDSLWSAADKCLARLLNSSRFRGDVIDVGSKYMQMNKLLDMKDHGVWVVNQAVLPNAWNWNGNDLENPIWNMNPGTPLPPLDINYPVRYYVRPSDSVYDGTYYRSNDLKALSKDQAGSNLAYQAVVYHGTI